MTFEPKMPTISFSSKVWKYWTDVHLRTVKLESRCQQLPVVKQNCSENRFNLEKSFSFIKSTKNIRFYPNHRMLNSYTFVLSRIKIKSVFPTINKSKNLCIPYTARKKWYFYQKITKIQLFDLKLAILNRYAYGSRNMEMNNSEVIKNWRNS